MSDRISSAYAKEFATNFEAAIGQRMAEIEKYCTPDPSFTGNTKRYNAISQVELERVTGRLQATNLQEPGFEFYWMMTQAFRRADGFDAWDESLLGNIVLPQSETLQEHVAAFARQFDTVIASNAVGSIYTGADTPTGSALPDSQKVASTYTRAGTTTASGLTYEKVLRALEIFGSNEIDIGEEGGLTAFVRMRQVTDLYASVEQFRQSGTYVTAVEPFQKDKLITTGELVWLGIRWKLSQRIPYVSSTDIASVPVFTRKGVKVVKEMKPTSISVRNDLNDALQILSQGRIGACRTNDKRVVSIACDESP